MSSAAQGRSGSGVRARSQAYKNWPLLLGLVPALAAGSLLAKLWPGEVRASELDVRPLVFSAEAIPGASLNPMPKTYVQDASRPQRFLLWSQPVYQGDVDRKTVEALINAERAESLEPSLSPEARRDLRKELYSSDQLVIEIGLQYDDEFRRVSKRLRESKDFVLIRTKPKEKDPNWPRVKAMEEKKRMSLGLIDNNPEPSMAGPSWNGKLADAPVSYVFLSWKRWPILRRYKEKYDMLLYGRVLKTRQWIANRFHRVGLSMFATH